MKIAAVDTYAVILPIKEISGGTAGYLEDCRSLIIRVETDNGTQPGGEMTGLLRLGKPAIFSDIDVKLATVTPTNTAGLGITVNRENLAELATRDP